MRGRRASIFFIPTFFVPLSIIRNFICVFKMIRYATIIVLLLACHGKAQSSDNTDELTMAWIKNNFPQDNKNNDVNSDTATQKTENVEDIVKWVSDVVNTNNEIKQNAETRLNLNPSNVQIQDTSFSKPAETSNKFDAEINSSNPVEQKCTTEDGVPGVCVVYYQCDPSIRKVIGDGTYLIDIRFGDGVLKCSHYLDVCCELNDRKTLEEEDISKQPALDIGPGYPELHGAATISEQHSITYRPEPVPDAGSTTNAAKECGWNDPDQFVFQPPTQEVADRGVYANYGEFPWMVALMRKSGTTVWVQNDYIGGGSLIHPSVVMTAYHKLLNVDAHELKCRAGEWDTQTEKEQYKIQERDADRFVAHPQFFRTSVYNDIALIFLKSPFDLAKAPHIGIACLASVLPDQASCFSMGWGKDIKSVDYVNILKKVKLPLVEHKTCETLLHTNTRFRHIPNFRLHESLTCAGGEENVDTCQGDGGSSLVCPIGHRNGRTRYAVVGMVAYGLACGKKDVPGVYVNVPHLYQWVEEEMAAAGYNSSTFSY